MRPVSSPRLCALLNRLKPPSLPPAQCSVARICSPGDARSSLLWDAPRSLRMFLGSDIGWVDVMDYHDADRSCTISMPELANVCRAHYDACIRFLDSSHTTKGARSMPRVRL